MATQLSRDGSRALRRLDADLTSLERAESLLRSGQARIDEDPREAFELIHRAALRAAGVVITRADRERRRKLPLNVWTALDRLGGTHRSWARDAREFVTERARLDRSRAARPHPELLARHRRMTADRIEAVREEVLSAGDLTPPAMAV